MITLTETISRPDVIFGTDRREIFRRLTGKVRFGKDRAFATLPVKAGEFTKGDYILILFGQTTDGRSEELDRYFFRVSNKNIPTKKIPDIFPLFFGVIEG